MHGGEASEAAPYGAPVDDQHVWNHVFLDEFEHRAGDGGNDVSWYGQAWIGTDTNRLWLKTEGVWRNDGDIEDGKHEILYDRPISTFFDVQAGLRVDADSLSGRTWAALGVQGLAPYFFDVSATLYASDGGHVAANFEGTFDLLLTQRLILQPQVEFNIYGQSDPARKIGSGLANIVAGLRLRYEISRKFAPYVGLSWQKSFGQTHRFAVMGGEDGQSLAAVFGFRVWL